MNSRYSFMQSIASNRQAAHGSFIESIAGSVIGELAETQEMLDFYADKGIVAEIEMGPAGGDARGRQLDEVGVHWVQVLRR
jgi:D-arabinose 1-dehydrogenase-like Zn-dependent alcohol dehydrogenase